MSLEHVLEHPKYPQGEIFPVWGNRYSALQNLKLLAPRLLQTNASTIFSELGEQLRRSFPNANVATSRPLWNTDQSHHAFVLARNEDSRAGDFGAITLLDIGKPANVTVVAMRIAYNGGDGVSFLAGGELTITSSSGEAPVYPGSSTSAGAFQLLTYDTGYKDAAVRALRARINGPTGHYSELSSPLHTLGDWLRNPRQVILLKPGHVDAAWFAPLLAAAAWIGGIAHTLEEGGSLKPWGKPLAFPGQELERPLLLVHAALEGRLQDEAAAARDQI